MKIQALSIYPLLGMRREFSTSSCSETQGRHQSLNRWEYITLFSCRNKSVPPTFWSLWGTSASTWPNLWPFSAPSMSSPTFTSFRRLFLTNPMSRLETGWKGVKKESSEIGSIQSMDIWLLKFNDNKSLLFQLHAPYFKDLVLQVVSGTLPTKQRRSH